MPLNLFISYSHNDAGWCKQIVKSIAILQKTRLIDIWTDQSISPGDEWSKTISANIRKAHIILLLISNDFLESYYCYDVELKEAINKHNLRKAVVMPILLRPCYWEPAPFACIQGLPREMKPLSQSRNREIALTAIARELHSTIKEFNQKYVFSNRNDQSFELDINKPIRIDHLRKHQKIDTAEEISNITIHPLGTSISFSQDDQLFVTELTDVFPEQIGTHQYRKSRRGSYIVEEMADVREPQAVPNGQINRIEISTRLVRGAHYSKITSITFSSDGEYIISSDSNGWIKIWRYRNRELIAECKAHDDAISALSVAPTGSYFASAGYDEVLNIWHINDFIKGKYQPIKVFEKRSKIKKAAKYAHDIEQITAIVFSPSGKHIASGDQQGIVAVRGIASGEEVYRKKVHNDDVRSLCFSPKEPGLLASASDDTRIRLLNCLKGEEPYTLGLGAEKHQDALNSIAFSYRGDIIVSSSCDASVRLWDVEHRRLIYSFTHDDGGKVDRVVFFPNRYDFATDRFLSDISLWAISNSGSVSHTKVDFQY